MTRRHRKNVRQKQINILHTNTRTRHSRKQLTQAAVWTGIVLAMIVAVGAGLHFGLGLVLDYALYHNPRYTLNDIQIEPRERFSPRAIRQAAGLEPGENLWTLDLPQITRDVEKLPYVRMRGWNAGFPTRSSSASTSGCRR